MLVLIPDEALPRDGVVSVFAERARSRVAAHAVAEAGAEVNKDTGDTAGWSGAGMPLVCD